MRQYREDDTNSLYPEDEEYRMMIPIEEIEASYRYLYGPDAVPNHHNIEEESQGFASSTIPIMRVIMCPLQRSRPIMSRFWTP